MPLPSEMRKRISRWRGGLVAVGSYGVQYRADTLTEIDASLSSLPAGHPDTDLLLDARLSLASPAPAANFS